jgi:DNA-binding MarR family transcriptional regulator
MTSLCKLNNLLTEFYDKMSSWELSVVRDTEYSLAQIHTLEVLGSFGAMRMKELASRLSITTGTLTVQIEKLVNAGLVERQTLEGDRRSILVSLTSNGRAVFEQHNTLHLNLTRELTHNFSDAERQQLVAALEMINSEF